MNEFVSILLGLKGQSDKDMCQGSKPNTGNHLLLV